MRYSSFEQSLEATVQALHIYYNQDFKIFQYFSNLPVKPPSLERVLERSTFQKVSNKQFLMAMKETGGKYIKDVGDLAIRHSTGVLATQMVEDIIGYQKNDTSGRPLVRFRRPEASMHKALCAKVIDERHGFQTASMQIPLKTKSTSLPQEAYLPSTRRSSLSFNGVASFKQNAPWFSPAAQHNGLPTAVLFVLRECHAQKRESLLALKFNDVFKLAHNFIFRYKNDKAGKWWLVVESFPNSGFVVLQCKLHTHQGINFEYFKVMELKEIIIKPVFDIDDIEVCHISWTCNHWLGGVLKRPLREIEYGHLAKKLSAPEPLVNLACRQACLVPSCVAI